MTTSAFIAVLIIAAAILSPIVYAAYVIWKDEEEGY